MTTPVVAGPVTTTPKRRTALEWLKGEFAALRELRWSRPIAALVAAIVLLVASTGAPEHSLFRELSRDFGIALLISVLVTIFIEQRSHAKKQQEITKSVFDAIAQTLIPAQAWEQLKATILRDGIACQHWKLTIRVSHEQVSHHGDRRQQKDVLISRGEQRYTLWNYLDRATSVLLRHEFETEASGMLADGPVPRVTRFSCNSVDKRFGAVDLAADANTPSLLKSGIVEARIEIPAGAKVNILLDRVEAISKQFPWYMVWLTLDTEVSVFGEPANAFDFSVRLRHPTARDWSPSEASQWRLQLPFLPGQGFAIMIEPKADAPSAA